MPRPIRSAYTIPYGAQFGAIRAGGARRHQGCDYHCPIGTPIYGTGDGGVVVARGYQPDPNSGAGNYVTIAYPGRRTTDMHMREASPLKPGSAVNAQTIVGYVGLTGNAVNASPPGSHDHHQLTVGGVLTDPEPYYGAEPAGSGSPTSTTKRRVNPVLSVTRLHREGVGTFVMFASSSTVSLSRELSEISEADREWELRLASQIAVAVGLPAELPLLDDTKDKDTGAADGWFLRNQLAFAAAGMPPNYPLAPGHPFIATEYYGQSTDGHVVDVAGLALAIEKLPTASETAQAVRENLIKPA